MFHNSSRDVNKWENYKRGTSLSTDVCSRIFKSKYLFLRMWDRVERERFFGELWRKELCANRGNHKEHLAS